MLQFLNADLRRPFALFAPYVTLQYGNTSSSVRIKGLRHHPPGEETISLSHKVSCVLTAQTAANGRLLMVCCKEEIPAGYQNAVDMALARLSAHDCLYQTKRSQAGIGGRERL
jgi:hypothetical protein